MGDNGNGKKVSEEKLTSVHPPVQLERDRATTILPAAFPVRSPKEASNPKSPDREIIHPDTAPERAESQIPAVARGPVTGSLERENAGLGIGYSPKTDFSVIL